ncbi:hypothetical protein SUGI_0959950 [Cryptomeria japonica]|nr:hypothetical protein SUGI_0959950 [Cryptomeria japonica]
MVPLLALELKIYGQWFLGGKSRLLSRVANPSTQICVVGNFVGATLAAKCGWKESAVFLFSVGISHYIVLFVTLYQKLPSNSSIPKQLHPVLFLFIALPSTACVAWESIAGSFENVARITYFLALFSFMALVVRINLFRGIRFSAAWWACAFPLNSLAIATIHYAQQMSSPVVNIMADIFSVISTLCVLFLSLATIINIQIGFWKKYKSIRNINH